MSAGPKDVGGRSAGVTRRWVALLRGINVGPHRRLAMADLRALLCDLGATDVATVLNSGNAIFGLPASGNSRVVGEAEVAALVEGAVSRALSMAVGCVVRPADEIGRVAGSNPLASLADDGARMLAVFLSHSPDPELLAAFDPTGLDPARIALGDRVIYQWCPDGVLAAPAVGAFVEAHLGVTATARNWNTLSKIARVASG